MFESDFYEPVIRFGDCKCNAETQRALDDDPRVIEYYEIEEGTRFEFKYAVDLSVNAIHRATASQLGITVLE